MAFQPVVERMAGSPTFRRQRRRLAADEDLQVKVLGEDQPTRASFADARTAMTFRKVLVTAVYLNTRRTPRSLAHELEHIRKLDRGSSVAGRQRRRVEER